MTILNEKLNGTVYNFNQKGWLNAVDFNAEALKRNEVAVSDGISTIIYIVDNGALRINGKVFAEFIRCCEGKKEGNEYLKFYRGNKN